MTDDTERMVAESCERILELNRAWAALLTKEREAAREWEITATNLLARAESAEAEAKRLREALAESTVAIDDWLNTYAYEHCDAKRVKEALERIADNGGTLAYIARIQKSARTALAKREGGEG